MLRLFALLAVLASSAKADCDGCGTAYCNLGVPVCVNSGCCSKSKSEAALAPAQQDAVADKAQVEAHEGDYYCCTLQLSCCNEERSQWDEEALAEELLEKTGSVEKQEYWCCVLGFDICCDEENTAKTQAIVGHHSSETGSSGSAEDTDDDDKKKITGHGSASDEDVDDDDKEKRQAEVQVKAHQGDFFCCFFGFSCCGTERAEWDEEALLEEIREKAGSVEEQNTWCCTLQLSCGEDCEAQAQAVVDHADTCCGGSKVICSTSVCESDDCCVKMRADAQLGGVPGKPLKPSHGTKHAFGGKMEVGAIVVVAAALLLAAVVAMHKWYLGAAAQAGTAKETEPLVGPAVEVPAYIRVQTA